MKFYIEGLLWSSYSFSPTSYNCSVTSLERRASAGVMIQELKRAAANRSVGNKVTEMPPRDGYTRRSFPEMGGKCVTWIITDDLSAIDDISYAIGTSAVVVLKNAGEVIELCRIGETQPHLVIADLDMRCTSGLILAALIRNHFPECKLWLLSEHADGIRQSLCRFSTLAHAQIVRKPLCLLQMC